MFKMIGFIYLVLLGFDSIYGWDFDYIDINPEVDNTLTFLYQQMPPLIRSIAQAFEDPSGKGRCFLVKNPTYPNKNHLSVKKSKVELIVKKVHL